MLSRRWKTIVGAYGPATKVPGWVKQLRTARGAQASEILRDLYAHICHQECDVFPATAAALPLLFQLAKEASVASRAPVLRLIGVIASVTGNGNAPDEATRQACSDALWKQEKLLGRLLDDSDAAVRTCAAFALAMYAQTRRHSNPERLAGARQALEARLDIESDVRVLACVIEGLGYFEDTQDRIAPFLDRKGDPALAAAMALSGMDVGTPQVVAQLVRALEDSQSLDEHWADSPFRTWRMRFAVLERIRQLGLPRAAPALDVLIEIAKSADGFTIEDDVGPLLDLLFTSQRHIPVRDWKQILRLSELQVRGLAAIADNAALFGEIDETGDVCVIGNVGVLFSGYGLPQSRPGLIRLLRASGHAWSEPPADPAAARGALARVVHCEQTTVEEVSELRLSGVATNALLAAVAGCSELRKLSVAESVVTDAGVRFLAALPSLRKLDLRETLVGDLQLRPLGELRSLEELDLHECGVTDELLAALTPLTALRRLALGRNPVQGGGCRHLPWSLEWLDLAGSAVDDQGLRGLVELKALRTLRLPATQLTGASLEVLNALDNLRVLDVSRTRTDDGALLRLVLPGLEELEIDETLVTAAVFPALARLPRLTKLKLGGKPVEPFNAGPQNPVAIQDRLDELIRAAPKLESLRAENTDLTDGSLLRLAELPLSYLWVRGTHVTQDGLEEFSRRRPQCTAYK